MNEDVKGIIAELIKLYDDGKIAIAKFEHAYETIVPSRFCDPTPDVEIGANGIPRFIDRNPKNISEHYQLHEIVKEADGCAREWVKSVNDLLSKVEQTRFKLQFNNPDQKGFFASSFGETTPAEDHLCEVVDDLTMRHAELRQIILELERNSEVVKKPDVKNIEPARYDKINRTIFFADEAIRFKKDATYPPAICELMFSHPEKKIWQLKDLLKLWDEVAYYGELNAPNDWHKVYEAVKRTNDRIKEKTGIDDLFLFSTTSVRLNPSYLGVTKKSQ